jgi:hypothetical protein
MNKVIDPFEALLQISKIQVCTKMSHLEIGSSAPLPVLEVGPGIYVYLLGPEVCDHITNPQLQLTNRATKKLLSNNIESLSGRT